MNKFNRLSILILLVFAFALLVIEIRYKSTLVSGISTSMSKVRIASGIKTDVYTTASISYKKVDREATLKGFFKKYNSPLVDHVDTFIRVADQYNLDYRLMPAISCMESTCARFLIPGTHNPFGWGGGLIKFDTYDEAIERVAKGLDEIYLSRGLDTPEKMAPVYTPPNHKNWLKGVRFFMDQIVAQDQT